MRAIIVVLMSLLMAAPSFAQPPVFKTIETKQAFESYVQKLKRSISAHKMGVVGEACATCGAQSIGVKIAGNRVIMIFNPHYAVRMLKASIPAGFEAPLRLYVTENTDGTAKLSYMAPSNVFSPYDNSELDKMARELDAIFEKIIQASMQ